jgi:hypothetical protein
MRRQGERPELIRWRLCGTSSPLPSWRRVYRRLEAPRAGRGRSSSANAIAEGGRTNCRRLGRRADPSRFVRRGLMVDLSDDMRAPLGPQYSEECRRLRADRCAEMSGHLIPHIEHSSGASIWPSGRIVVLNRPIFRGGRPLDEALKVRWIGPHFFFSFELSYQREFRSPVWAGLRGRWSGLTRNLLQSLPSLCRMVVRGLD